MVWGAISYKGMINLGGIDGKMDSQYYQHVLSESHIPDLDKMHGEDWVFQHDNAAVNSSNLTKTFLDANEAVVMDWQTKSPDVNIIESVWGHMARRVYQNGRQYVSVSDLQEAIMEAWEVIDTRYIRSLYRSISTRLVEIVENQGRIMDY